MLQKAYAEGLRAVYPTRRRFQDEVRIGEAAGRTPRSPSG